MGDAVERLPVEVCDPQPAFDGDAIAAMFDVGAGVARRFNRIGSAALLIAASPRPKARVVAEAR
jgi:hypothetical protein